MRYILNLIKKIFWLMPISPKYKEKIRMMYATQKDKRQSKLDAGIEISSEIDKEAYIEQVLKIPNCRSEEYVDFISHEEKKFSVDMIAYYLTQYHPNPQNDKWWGVGTTEWTNVSKAVPQYVGHCQPRLPGELGYYDLRLVDTFKRQIRLAHNYGIKAFCFYYYWFDGERLLEKPLDLFLGEEQLDIEYCICWANENWTKRFTGTNADILMKMGESQESYINFIYDALMMFTDKRYYTIGGKPILLIYRPSLIPDSEVVIGEWKRIVQEELGMDLYVIAVQEKGDKTNWINKGFDAETEFQPKRVNDVATDITHKMKTVNKNFSGTIFDYEDLVEKRKYLITNNMTKKVYPAVMPMWDNTARRDSAGIIYHGANAQLYGKWLKDAISLVKKNESLDKRIVFINAWNEWGEGTYLEPDRKNGYAYLEKTYQILVESEVMP